MVSEVSNNAKHLHIEDTRSALLSNGMSAVQLKLIGSGLFCHAICGQAGHASASNTAKKTR